MNQIKSNCSTLHYLLVTFTYVSLIGHDVFFYINLLWIYLIVFFITCLLDERRQSSLSHSSREEEKELMADNDPPAPPSFPPSESGTGTMCSLSISVSCYFYVLYICISQLAGFGIRGCCEKVVLGYLVHQ